MKLHATIDDYQGNIQIQDAGPRWIAEIEDAIRPHRSRKERRRIPDRLDGRVLTVELCSGLSLGSPLT